MFSLDNLLQELAPHRSTPTWQRSLLRSLLFENEFQQFAQRYPHLKGLDLVEQVLDHFSLNCEMVEGDLENIPSRGPVVLVANHPIGSLDGLALLRTVASVRPDVRVVASQLLSRIEPLKNLFFRWIISAIEPDATSSPPFRNIWPAMARSSCSPPAKSPA